MALTFGTLLSSQRTNTHRTGHRWWHERGNSDIVPRPLREVNSRSARQRPVPVQENREARAQLIRSIGAWRLRTRWTTPGDEEAMKGQALRAHPPVDCGVPSATSAPWGTINRRGKPAQVLTAGRPLYPARKMHLKHLEAPTGAGASRKGVRRCPTLPHPGGCSTIGAGGLSFRVRDGSGRFPSAMAAVTCVELFRLGALGGAGWPCSGSCTVDAWHVVVVSPRPISTGQLHTLRCFHFRPINPVVWLGALPLERVGDLILERASRLDAFSGYPFRT